MLKAQYYFTRQSSTLTTKKPGGNVVVLGSGWGAFKTINQIDTSKYNVLVVSPRNHFVFTPLLASTTVGTLEFRCITEPIRQKKLPLTYYSAWCNKVNFKTKQLECQDSIDNNIQFNVPYDKLVIAVGAYSNTFNIPGVVEYAHFLKEIEHARKIRTTILEKFEHAAQPNTTTLEKQESLHFAIVGAGPTGIEFSGELFDFVMEDLKRLYPDLIQYVRISIYDVSSGILGGFNSALSEYATKKYTRAGIEICTNTVISRVEKNHLVLSDGTKIPYGLLVWSTGITSTPLVKSLDLKEDKANRILTNEFLQVESSDGKLVENVYAIGDCAVIEDNLLPATAQVASQKGIWLAKSLNAKAIGKPFTKGFIYNHMGSMVYTGTWSALVDWSNTKLNKSMRGKFAWFIWRSAYLSMSVSVKNKILIPMYWFLTFIFGRDHTKF